MGLQNEFAHIWHIILQLPEGAGRVGCGDCLWVAVKLAKYKLARSRQAAAILTGCLKDCEGVSVTVTLCVCVFCLCVCVPVCVACVCVCVRCCMCAA